MTIEYARKITERGMFFIPLLPNAKKNYDTDYLTKDYSEKDLFPNGNVGINPKKSGVDVIDLDSPYAIQFGNLWLPKNTTIGARQYPDGRIEKTHWYFKSDGSLEKNIKSLPAELYIDHNIVAFGTTIHKELKVPMKRFWACEDSLLPFNDSILATFNKINFASKIAEHLKSVIKGAFAFDCCLWRYCKTWTDEDREKFLLDFYSVVAPEDKEATKKSLEE